MHNKTRYIKEEDPLDFLWRQKPRLGIARPFSNREAASVPRVGIILLMDLLYYFDESTRR